MDRRTIGGSRIKPGWVVAAGLGLIALVAAGVPLVSLLYLGLILVCPLMMAGMHHGHGHAHVHDHEAPENVPERGWSSDLGDPSSRAGGPPAERGRS